MYIYGVVAGKYQTHHDVSTSEIGAKRYATKLGLKYVTIRNRNSYIARIIAEKINGKWKPLNPENSLIWNS